MFIDKVGDVLFCCGDGINLIDSIVLFFVYYCDEFKVNVMLFYYSVLGFEIFLVFYLGLENYFVLVVFVFGDYCIWLKWDVKISEYIGFDEEFLNVEFDGDDFEDMLNGEFDEQGNYFFDEVIEVFFELLCKYFFLGDFDIWNLFDLLCDMERCIVENVVFIIV